LFFYRLVLSNPLPVAAYFFHAILRQPKWGQSPVRFFFPEFEVGGVPLASFLTTQPLIFMVMNLTVLFLLHSLSPLIRQHFADSHFLFLSPPLIPSTSPPSQKPRGVVFDCYLEGRAPTTSLFQFSFLR